MALSLANRPGTKMRPRYAVCHIGADQIAAHDAACKDNRQARMLGQRIVGHAHECFAYKKQAVFADIRGILSLGQQSGTLVLQPGQAAGKAVYADFGADFFGAEGSLLTDIDTSRERIAKLLRPAGPRPALHRGRCWCPAA